MMRRPISSLRVRLLALVLLAVLPALGLIVYSAVDQQHREVTRAQVEARLLARLVASHQDRLVEGARQLLAGLAELPEVRGRDARACSALLSTILTRVPLYTALVVAGPDGEVWCSALPLKGRLSAADRLYFRRAVETRAFAVGDYQIGRLTGKATLGFGQPLLGSAGAVEGVLIASLDLGWLNQPDLPRPVQPGARVVVLDGNGTVLARFPDPERLAGKTMADAPIVRIVLSVPGGGTAEAPGLDGVLHLWGFTPMAGGAAHVLVGAPRDVVLADAKRVLVRNLLLLGLVGALALLAAWVGGDLFVRRRVGAVIAAARRMEAGDLRARAGGPYGSGELDQLARVFDEMAEALGARQEDLEARVAERTRALEARTREAHATAALLRAQDAFRLGYAELAALLNSLDRSHILAEATKKIAGTLQAPLAAVYLTEEGPAGLRLKTYAAVDPGALDTAVLDPAGLPGEVARRREPVVVTVADRDEPLRLRVGLGTVDVGAVAGHPLVHQDRLLGVLVVALLQPPDESARSFLDSAARQLSVALSNAGLFESVRYQSQQLERLNVELLRASDVKSQFLASMSHELRTPLNSIIGFTELMLASAKDPLSQRQRTALEKVHASGKHLLGLINDVLDLSKIEAGRMEVHPEPFAPAVLVAECLGAVEPQAQAKGLRVQALGLETLPEMVQDRRKVQQILLNLLSNAVKFTASGGIDVRAEVDTEGSVNLTVADTGPGIRPEDQAAIFDAFRQADSAAIRAAGGTGLGLAVSRRLAGLLGGTLTVESAPGQGSVFTLRVPRQYQSGAPPAAAEAELAPPPGAVTVLVVDDDRDVLELLQETLAGEGFWVDWAPSAAAGLGRARAHRPAVIMLDLILQGAEDGWEVLQALKTDPATREIPVLVHSVIDNAGRAEALGAEGVLVKPASPEAVRARLRTLAARARPAPLETPHARA